MRHRIVTWSAVIVAMLAPAGPAFAQVSLKWKFAEGGGFTLQRVYQQKQVIEVKAKSFKQDTTSTWTTRFLAKKVTAEEIVLEQTIVSVVSKNSPQPKAGSDLALTAQLTEKMKGSVLTLTVTPAGRVRKLEGYDELIKKLGEGKAELEKSLRVLIPESVLRDGLEETLGFLPETPLKPKDRWQRLAVDPVPPFGVLKTTFQYVYEGPENGLETVQYTTATTFVPSLQDLGLIKVVKGEIQTEEGRGKVLFDRDKGLLVRGEKQVRLRGNLTLETAGNVTSNLEFTSENSLRWRLVDEKK